VTRCGPVWYGAVRCG